MILFQKKKKAPCGAFSGDVRGGLCARRCSGRGPSRHANDDSATLLALEALLLLDGETVHLDAEIQG
jgi:hypothetical protein